LHFVATAQRGFDVIENEASRELVHLSPIQRRVIDVERPSFSEQPLQRNLLYQISGNPDFAWVGGGGLLQEYPDAEKRLYDLSKPPPWQSRPPRTEDLFLVQASEYPFEIHLRGVGPHGLPLALVAKNVHMLQERLGLPLVEVRKWRSEWNVYQPWTLRKRKLVFSSVLCQAVVQSGDYPLRPAPWVDGPKQKFADGISDHASVPLSRKSQRTSMSRAGWQPAGFRDGHPARAIEVRNRTGFLRTPSSPTMTSK
jgi:hypothetical protein